MQEKTIDQMTAQIASAQDRKAEITKRLLQLDYDQRKSEGRLTRQEQYKSELVQTVYVRKTGMISQNLIVRELTFSNGGRIVLVPSASEAQRLIYNNPGQIYAACETVERAALSLLTRRERRRSRQWGRGGKRARRNHKKNGTVYMQCCC
jgi:hypothetical protein